MATPILGYEVRYRPAGSGQNWTIQNLGPQATGLTLTGLPRGQAFECQLRAIGPGGLASAWVDANFTVATSNRAGAAAYPPAVVGNVGSRWVDGTAVTYSASTTSATISVTAGTLQVADNQISYGASSATVAGTASSAQTFYLYYDDPFYQGGARTLGVTTDPVASMSDFGRVFITAIKVTFPASGTSGGGGGIGGSGGGTGNAPYMN